MTQTQAVGLKIGDLCTIVTPHKNKKYIQLNRTNWDIYPEGDSVSPQFPSIPIPGAKPRSFYWRLELKSFEGSERFVLRSVDNTFFRLNGQFTREALIESFDVLASDMFWGRIEFLTNYNLKNLRTENCPVEIENEAVVKSSIPILIQGESGTGKSHLARKIHDKSQRSGSFLALNLSAMNESLIESELFGHMKGSFTGANSRHYGAFSQAKGGTIFLDEIDSLSTSLQLKLLLFLDSGKFRPVGSVQEESSDARVLFASGQRLDNLVTAGKMRRDFYFRLSQGITCSLKPLRDDPRLIQRHCQIYGIENKLVITKRLIDFYITLPWPGNLRQLRGHLEAKRILSKTKKLDFDETDEKLLLSSSNLLGLVENKKVRPFDEIKREYAKFALDSFQGRYDLAAKELQVNVKTLKSWTLSELECG